VVGVVGGFGSVGIVSERSRRTFALDPGHPVVMGVLNVTPDSFSDGGRYADLDAAVAHGIQMWRDGADLIDVGGESTRPGAERVDADSERRRVVPVIRALASEGVPMSIDTTRAAVAEAALDAGVSVVNDVSGGLADPDMGRLVAAAGCPWILMHWRGHSRRMYELASYADVVAEVRDELAARIDDALRCGVPADRVVIDPGLGFAKKPAHNWQLLSHLDALLALGFPVLVAASRKSFLGELLAAPDGTPRPVDDREAASVATNLCAVAAGAWGVRVHEVRATVDAIRVWQAIAAGTAGGDGVGHTALPGHTAAPGLAAGRGGVAAASAGRRPDGWVTGQAGPADSDRGSAGRWVAGTDRIALTGLRVRGRHGVYDFERAEGQDFVVDAVLELDLRRPAGTDEVADTVHYGELADRLAGIVAGEPVNLIETLAGRLADACLADPRVAAVELTVHKPGAPISHEFTDVAVTLHRRREEGS
jgi:dihydropteroate synthase